MPLHRAARQHRKASRQTRSEQQRAQSTLAPLLRTASSLRSPGGAHRQPSRLVLNNSGLADALKRLGHVRHHGALAGLHGGGMARAAGRRARMTWHRRKVGAPIRLLKRQQPKVRVPPRAATARPRACMGRRPALLAAAAWACALACALRCALAQVSPMEARVDSCLGSAPDPTCVGAAANASIAVAVAQRLSQHRVRFRRARADRSGAHTAPLGSPAVCLLSRSRLTCRGRHPPGRPWRSCREARRTRRCNTALSSFTAAS